MHREDYRRLSDDGLAHVTILEQENAKLKGEVEHLRAALEAKVDTNPAAAPIDHAILIALRADLEAARQDVEEARERWRRERGRMMLLSAATNGFMDEFQKFYNGLPDRCFRGEFYAALNTLEELLKLIKANQT